MINKETCVPVECLGTTSMYMAVLGSENLEWGPVLIANSEGHAVFLNPFPLPRVVGHKI